MRTHRCLCVQVKYGHHPRGQTHPRLNQVGISAGLFWWRGLLLQTAKTYVLTNPPYLHPHNADTQKELSPIRTGAIYVHHCQALCPTLYTYFLTWFPDHRIDYRRGNRDSGEVWMINNRGRLGPWSAWLQSPLMPRLLSCPHLGLVVKVNLALPTAPCPTPTPACRTTSR